MPTPTRRRRPRSSTPEAVTPPEPPPPPRGGSLTRLLADRRVRSSLQSGGLHGRGRAAAPARLYRHCRLLAAVRRSVTTTRSHSSEARVGRSVVATPSRSGATSPALVSAAGLAVAPQRAPASRHGAWADGGDAARRRRCRSRDRHRSLRRRARRRSPAELAAPRPPAPPRSSASSPDRLSPLGRARSWSPRIRELLAAEERAKRAEAARHRAMVAEASLMSVRHTRREGSSDSNGRRQRDATEARQRGSKSNVPPRDEKRGGDDVQTVGA